MGADSTARLVHHLLSQAEPITIPYLAQMLEISDSVLATALDELRRSGCVLQTHPDHGVKLMRTGLGIWADYLKWHDQQHARGSARHIEVYAKVASTQNVIRRLIKSSGQTAHGAVAIADAQTQGRGRLWRRWIAPAGTSVMFSLAWVDSAATQDRLMFATTVAVARTLEIAAGPRSLSASIRWPNDILVEGQKLAGILVERMTFPGSGDGAAVIGVGINVDLDPQQLRPQLGAEADEITSLAMHGANVDRLKVLAAAIEQMETALVSEDVESLMQQWRVRSILLDKLVSFCTDGRDIRGRVVDLDPSEGLIVQTDSGGLMHLPGDRTTTL